MILKSYEIKKINKNNNPLILFYGKNEGLKNEAFDILIKDKNNILNYEEKEILDNENNFIENILSKYNKNTISKDTSGVATNFKVSVNAKISIINGDKIKEFEFNEKINIKNNLDAFEQNNYERHIKKNFASSIREKLITKILNTNDN